MARSEANDNHSFLAPLRPWFEKLDKAKRNLQHSMSRSQWEAVAAAKRIAAEQKIKGVHGMLIELFHVKVHCRAILRNSAQFRAILRNSL